MMEITIDREKCTQCLECIEVCPGKVLMLVEGRPVHAYTSRCERCATCLNICPEGAIVVKNIQREKQRPTS
ncbi:MAG: 4Fe-4S dicluster domain-containing protein [Candidatus Electrothrix sp. ATG2]|nr:4Fe-4S dicluster domain-containing protein [Candidatus Electrothrix sp. ATG2]